MNHRLLFGSLLVVAISCERAQAVDTLHVLTAQVPSPLVVQNDLLIDFDFYLAGQSLSVELAAGSIVYDICPQCDVVDLSTMTSVFLGSPANPSAATNFAIATPTELEVTWAPDPLTIFNQDDFHVARVFLSPNAQGTWSYVGEEVHPAAFLPAAPTIRGTILAGVMMVIPEPATLPLLLMATAITLRRPKNLGT